MNSIFLLIALYIAVVNSYGIVTVNEPCPVPNYPSTFDVQKAKGKWYDLYAYPSVYFSGFECYTLDHELTEGNKYNHRFCEKYDGAYNCSVVELDHAYGDGRFNFDLGPVQGHGYYLYIDYNSLFILALCKDLENGSSERNLWITSRKPTVDEDTLNNAYEIVEKGGFDANILRPIEQDKKFCKV